MFVAELFRSIQGEGLLAGTPSAFLRTSGCNLRCWFCDTPHTSFHPEGTHREVDDLFTQLVRMECQHVVLTGGEPLLQPEIVPLSEKLAEAGYHITVETAGTVFRPVRADLMSISPKLANSTPRDAKWQPMHADTRHAPDVIRELVANYSCQFKFVIDTPADVDEVDEYLREFPQISADQVWLMPQAVQPWDLEIKSGWLAQLASERGFHRSPRLHIARFGHQRGT